MDIPFKFAGIGLISVILALILKKETPELAVLLSIVAGCLIFLLAADILGELLSFLREQSEKAGLSAAIITPVLKTLGIALITQFTADSARDNGQTAIASCIETGGTAAALYVSLPLMQTLLSTLSAL